MMIMIQALLTIIIVWWCSYYH